VLLQQAQMSIARGLYGGGVSLSSSSLLHLRDNFFTCWCKTSAWLIELLTSKAKTRSWTLQSHGRCYQQRVHQFPHSRAPHASARDHCGALSRRTAILKLARFGNIICLDNALLDSQVLQLVAKLVAVAHLHRCPSYGFKAQCHSMVFSRVGTCGTLWGRMSYIH
jgi:hypothetical protein